MVAGSERRVDSFRRRARVGPALGRRRERQGGRDESRGARRPRRPRVGGGEREEEARAAELPPVHAWPSLNDAAETLLDAETLLANNPRLEGAKASVAEAAILCGRIARAIDVCKTMLEDSADRAYLRAEALWRGGDIDAGDRRDLNARRGKRRTRTRRRPGNS